MLLSVLATASTASGQAAAAERLAALRAITPVSAYGDHAAWSRYVAERRVYRLVLRARGRTRTVPVAPCPVPFDVDLGLGPNGRVVAVYSRCRREPTEGALPGGLPDYSGTRGCRLYRFDIVRRRERPVRRRLDAPPNRYQPAIWGQRIALVASSPGVCVDGGPGRRTRRLPGGTAGPRDDTRGPAAVDIDERRVAYTWLHDRTCPNVPRGEYGDPDRSELWLDDLRTRSHTLVARGEPGGCPGGEAGRVSSPTLHRGHLAYLRWLPEGTTDSGLADRNLRTGAITVTGLPLGAVSVALSPHGVVLNHRTRYDASIGQDASAVLRQRSNRRGRESG